MTLNDLERRNCRYFALLSPNSIALQADYVTVVEDKPIMSVKYCLPVPVFHIWPKLLHLQCALSAIAQHLVYNIVDYHFLTENYFPTMRTNIRSYSVGGGFE